MITTLAYRPFIDALTLNHVWFTMLVPLSLFIAITWKAIRLTDDLHADGTRRFPWRRFVLGVGSMTVQIVASMVALGAASYLLVQYAVPALAPR